MGANMQIGSPRTVRMPVATNSDELEPRAACDTGQMVRNQYGGAEI